MSFAEFVASFLLHLLKEFIPLFQRDTSAHLFHIRTSSQSLCIISNYNFIVVYLQAPYRINTIMSTKPTPKEIAQLTRRLKVTASKNVAIPKRTAKFSPAWVVVNPRESPDFNLELINRIRRGVKKSDWKDLINKIGATEKEFENILPASISSMQKKTVYGKETSERIYELAKLFGLGYEVFDTKEDFKNWLTTPSRTLGNKKPFELLDSSLGFEMVENEITRIQYNVYS